MFRTRGRRCPNGQRSSQSHSLSTRRKLACNYCRSIHRCGSDCDARSLARRTRDRRVSRWATCVLRETNVIDHRRGTHDGGCRTHCRNPFSNGIATAVRVLALFRECSRSCAQWSHRHAEANHHRYRRTSNQLRSARRNSPRRNQLGELAWTGTFARIQCGSLSYRHA